jgi:hypothetical protein
MEQKHRLVSLSGTGKFTVTELCADFQISRKTAHTWLRRYHQAGTAGLRDHSRHPHGCTHQIRPGLGRCIGGKLTHEIGICFAIFRLRMAFTPRIFTPGREHFWYEPGT